MTKSQQRALADALADLEALCDPANTTCAIAPEHKRAVAPFVSSWITGYVQMALRDAVLGRDLNLAQIYRNGRGSCRSIRGAKILDDLQKQKQAES